MYLSKEKLLLPAASEPTLCFSPLPVFATLYCDFSSTVEPRAGELLEGRRSTSLCVALTMDLRSRESVLKWITNWHQLKRLPLKCSHQLQNSKKSTRPLFSLSMSLNTVYHSSTQPSRLPASNSSDACAAGWGVGAETSGAAKLRRAAGQTRHCCSSSENLFL